MIISSQCFICVFAVVINTVSSQDTVEGVIGGSVVLPCSSTEDDVKIQECFVYWRHNDSKIVFDIDKGKDSLAKQDQEYKNRTESFPEEYSRRNFSIKLKNLQHTDTGEFSCFISPTDERMIVQLIIKGEKEKESPYPENQDDPGAKIVKESSKLHLLWILLVVPIVFIASFFYHQRKAQKNKAAFACVTTEDK